MKRVFVVGGGASLKGFDFSLLDGEAVIAVNKAGFDVRLPLYFITMDYTFLRKVGRDKVAKLPCTKIFIANFHPEYIQNVEGRIVDTRFNLIYDLSPFDTIMKSYDSDGLGFQMRDFRSGGNSGYCGFQLAVTMGYKEIYLMGIDLVATGEETHYHGGYGEGKDKFVSKLDGYYEKFRKGLLLASVAGIKVTSCSPISRLNNAIPYKDAKEVLGG